MRLGLGLQLRRKSLPASAEEPYELPVTYTVTGVFTDYSGHTGDGSGLRDGLDSASSTVWAAGDLDAEPHPPRITMHLGGEYYVSHITVRSIPFSFGSWGAGYTNDCNIEYRSNSVDWTYLPNLSGLVDGQDLDVPIEQLATEIRLTKLGWLAMSELRATVDPNPM
jgi:hypothetical protein